MGFVLETLDQFLDDEGIDGTRQGIHGHSPAGEADAIFVICTVNGPDRGLHINQQFKLFHFFHFIHKKKKN